MATLTQLQDTSGDDPTLQVDIDNSPIVEPLGGPLDIEILLTRFPESLYDLSSDTHLYRLLTALTGDSGSGLLDKQAYAARLLTEGPLLTFQELDNFYVQSFSFPRIKSELYPIDASTGLPLDPTGDALIPTEWDALEAADSSYKHRIQNFFNATRLGNSPDGIRLAGLATTGIDIDTIENYKAVYDTLSDDQLEIVLQGTTFSANEFILTPRVLNADGSADTSVSYTTPLGKQYNPGTNVTTWVTANTTYLNPDLERNMIDTMDRLRPVNSLMTVTAQNVHYKTVPVTDIEASSSRMRVSRFVTGNPAVNWPAPNPSNGTFIQSNVENEASTLALSSNDQATTFYSVERIIAYENTALLDPTYNTPAFLTGNPAPFQKYRSEKIGTFYKVIASIFTFLRTAPTATLFGASLALPANTVPATISGKSDNNGGL